ncbi:DUF2147 domain-containing protein [Muriicola sp. Z0-33]|uniref:DUF2147 domain-containing protein n=1 Tax=Muriicola sp. Z0-33 TaxID=2816957 RepID=UPI0022387BBE|nr:DUF2147 domain-containing protein [Muriicola sp. Z0-33]MCW5517108.1 DUF2147 domain-containing protein [Muriicola sp. Z0-33]
MIRPNNLLTIGLLLFVCQICTAQSIFGKWKTIDDRTGKPKAIINVYKKGELMYGKVESILEIGREEARCVKCEGDRKDQPIMGMTIIDGLQKNKNDEWKGKTLFDPEQAMTFRCKIWLNPSNSNELKVRGYLAFLFRTQTWLRVED